MSGDHWDDEGWKEAAREYATNRPKLKLFAQEEQKANGHSGGVIRLKSAFPIDEAAIPLRDWIIPGLLLRRHLSLLVAPPSSSKSLLTLQIAVMVATGMPWAGWHPRCSEKVLVINAEDDLDEMRRRLCAIAKEMGVDQTALVDRIVLVEDPESIVVAKADNRTKTVIRTPLIEELVGAITQFGIGVVIADPFAETFEGDENSNSEVKWAAIIWREVARRTATALKLVHHTPKGSGAMAGNPDAARGGGALVGTARIVSTLFPLTEKDAAAMNIPERERLDYVQFNDAKTNYCKLENARWFKKKTVTLVNGPPGDDVGVLVPWTPPEDSAGMTTMDINSMLTETNGGIMDEHGNPSGRRYSSSPRSKDRAAWRVIQKHFPDKSEAQCRKIINAWLESGLLISKEYFDPVDHKMRTGLWVDDSKRPN